MTTIIVQYPMYRTIFVAVSSLHLVEVVNAENVHVSSKGSSRHGDFAKLQPTK
jgi:hypothetical protein